MDDNSSLLDVIEELSCLYLVNLPNEELQGGIERVFYQLQQAYWRYTDVFVPSDCYIPPLPRMTLRSFCRLFFNISPILSPLKSRFDELFVKFLEYIRTVPVCGTILLNESLSKLLLVRGYNKSCSWTFPKGKINKDESEIDCAVRETFEEVGYNVQNQISSNPNNRIQLEFDSQLIRLYIIPNIPEKFNFSPKMNYEIGSIKWFDIDSLAIKKSGSHFWRVHQFLPHIHKWLNHNKSKYYENNHHIQHNNNAKNSILDFRFSKDLIMYEFDTRL